MLVDAVVAAQDLGRKHNSRLSIIMQDSHRKDIGMNYTYITADDLENIKQKVIKLQSQRTGYGSDLFKHKITSSSDPTEEVNEPLDATAREIKNALLEVNDFDNDNTIRSGSYLVDDIDYLERRADTLINATEANHGCRGACAGMCTGSCSNKCSGCSQTASREAVKPLNYVSLASSTRIYYVSAGDKPTKNELLAEAASSTDDQYESVSDNSVPDNSVLDNSVPDNSVLDESVHKDEPSSPFLHSTNGLPFITNVPDNYSNDDRIETTIIKSPNSTTNTTNYEIMAINNCGCTGTCNQMCTTTCYGGCWTGCLDACAGQCRYQCWGHCWGSCISCTGSCNTECKTTCLGECTGCGSGCASTCSTGCKGTCKSSCTGCRGCGSSCSSGCSSTCTGSCSGSCTGGCGSTCKGSCSGSCTGCSSSCSGSCHGSCLQGCTGACKQSCMTGCDTNCYSNCTATCYGSANAPVYV